jgi:hypothetical protein
MMPLTKADIFSGNVATFRAHPIAFSTFSMGPNSFRHDEEK